MNIYRMSYDELSKTVDDSYRESRDILDDREGNRNTL